MPLKHSVEEIVLKNGARGLLIDIPDSTVVSYDIHFRAGNHYVQNKEAQQTAHIMEHMAFGATKTYPSIDAYSQAFTKNGAYNNASTWQHHMSYYADCADFEWDRILDLQRQAITEPIFSQELLTAEKGNVSEELTGQANNHGRVLWQTLYRELGDPAFTDAEKIQTIPVVTLEDIQRHHKSTHTLRNMRFSLAGNLGKHKDQIIASLEKWQLPVGERLPLPSQQLHSAAPVRIERKDLPSIIFAFNICLNRRLTEDEQTAFGAINHILTGTFHSRIWGEARKRGICYGMNSGTDTDVDGISRWEFSGQIRPQNAEEIFHLIADQLAAIRDGAITKKELDEAKEFALGGHQMRGQTVRSINGWYAGYYFETGMIDAMEKAPERIQAVSLSTIKRVVREMLEDGEWVVGAIGNISEEQVQKLNDIVAPLFKNGVQ